MNFLFRRDLASALACAVLCFSPREAFAQEADIPVDGLELWVKADGPMKVVNNQITEWSDASGKGNNAIHDAFGQGIPVLATSNGKPTMRFSGAYTGFQFTKISTVRTVFAVLSKDSTSCLPTLPNYGTPAKFWIGGNADPTYFHPEHGCSIYNSNLSEVSPNLVNGKTYLNGKLVDGRTTRFPFTLGLLSLVSLADVSADTIARDRGFQDRSWQGDISELLIYSKPLDDVTRVKIQNVLAAKYAITVEGGPVIPTDPGGAGGTAGTSGAGAGAGGTHADAGAGGSSGAGAASGGGSTSSSAAGASTSSSGGAGSSGASGAATAGATNNAAAGGNGGAATELPAAGAGASAAAPASSGCSCEIARSSRRSANELAVGLSFVIGLALSRRRRRAIAR